MLEIQIRTGKREEIIDITRKVADALASSDLRNGALVIFCPHTTCGLTINEGADPDVRSDVMKFFQTIAPSNHDWAHAEGNSDAHIRSSVLGVDLLIPVENKELKLGRWQSIYLYEGDGPRIRSLWLQFLK